MPIASGPGSTFGGDPYFGNFDPGATSGPMLSGPPQQQQASSSSVTNNSNYSSNNSNVVNNLTQNIEMKSPPMPAPPGMGIARFTLKKVDHTFGI